jgi:ketosteroid isomerase-like protein
MMAAAQVSDIVRRCFQAYEKRDRALIEPLLGDGFSFTSPYDDHIDRDAYFERCWPNAHRIRGFRIESLVVEGDQAFVLYEVEFTRGGTTRNVERFRVERGAVREIEVFFGSPTT